MELTILQSWDCLWILSYQFNGWVIKPYTIPLNAPDHIAVVVYVEPKEWCCISHRVVNWLTVQTGGESYDAGSLTGTVTIEVVLVPCSRDATCMPRYKNYDALLAKANCLCSSLGIELAEAIPGSGRWSYVIYDKCLPEEWNQFWFHVIATVVDPNYLLQTIECICENKLSSSEYIYEYTPPTPDKKEPIDPIDPKKK